MATNTNPNIFGKYRLIHPLAEGGMAEIYLAKQLGLADFEKTVVVKRVLPNRAQNAEFVQMFLDEARISARLSHPNVVQIFDFGQEQGSYYLAMEYLAGEDLRSIMRASRAKGLFVPSQIAALVIAGAADGLHYAHTATDETGRTLGIVHRDVSPSNIFVTYQGVVKVLDFGIAKAEGKLLETRTGVLKGKFMYMSPEQVSGRVIDGRSDVFALGAVLYELLTGVRLFQRENELAILRAVTDEPIAPPRTLRPELAPEINDIVIKALERDRDQRYRSADEMKQALDHFISQRTYRSSVTQLQQYLGELFGEEYVKEKSRPHMLEKPSQGASGPDSLPPISINSVPEGVAGGSNPTRLTGMGAAAAAEADQSRRNRRSLVLVLGLLLIMGIAMGVGMTLFSQRPLERGAVPAAAKPADELPPPAQPGPPLDPQRSGGRAVADSLTAPGNTDQPSKGEQHPAGGSASATDAQSHRHLSAGSHSGEGASRKSSSSGNGHYLNTASLPPPPIIKFGTLAVNCIPWCRIYIDGVDTNRNSPARDIRVAAGVHRVKVVNPPTGSEREREIEIGADQENSAMFKF